MVTGGISVENRIRDLELIVVNNENHAQHTKDLRASQKFLSQHYSANKVIPLESIMSAISDSSNDAYSFLIKKNAQGKIEAVVVYDVWNVPRKPIDNKLVADGKNHYTALFYATAAGKEQEPLLRDMVYVAKRRAQQYSAAQGKHNVGMLTDDVRHIDVLKSLGGKYLAKVGVPPLDIPEDATDQEYEKLNFRTDRVNGKKQHEKLVVLPMNGTKWTRSMVERVVASYLDEGYNTRKGFAGYRPLTQAEYFKEFTQGLYGQYENGRDVVQFKPIAFKK